MVERSGGDEIEIALHGLSIIEPPKLEDAGLEDCALPPHSILEAFSRAAAFSKSLAVEDDDDDEDEEEEESAANIGVDQVAAVKDGDDGVAIVGGDDKGCEKPLRDGEGYGDKDPRVLDFRLDAMTDMMETRKVLIWRERRVET